MAKQKTLKINVTMEGADETLKAFRRLPKEASAQLRDKAQKLSQALVGRIQTAALSDRSPQARLFAPTVRAKRDRVPAITAGGAKKVGRRRQPVFGVLFGGEFGSNRFSQFGKPHTGREPTGPVFGVVERERAEVAKAWTEAAEGLAKDFARDGG